MFAHLKQEIIKYFNSNSINGSQNNASIDVLPADIKRLICSYLDPRSISFFSMTSKKNLHELLPVLLKIQNKIFSPVNMGLIGNYRDSFFVYIKDNYYYRQHGGKFENIQKLNWNLPGKILKVATSSTHTLILTTVGLYCNGNDRVSSNLGYDKIGYEFGLGYNNNPQTKGFEEIKTKPENMEQISLGYRHSLLLTQEGKLYACGNNEIGGFGPKDSSCNIFTQVNLPFNTPVKKIAAGSRHNLILTTNGDVYICGRVKTWFGNVCYSNWTTLENVKGVVKDIYSGPNFSILWTTEGVFGLGSGFGRNLSKIDLPPDIKIKQIVVGYNITLILDENGLLYRHDCDEKDSFEIQCIKYGLDEPIQQLTGDEYTIAITSKGIYENHFESDDEDLRTWNLITEFRPVFNKINLLNNLINCLKKLDLNSQEETRAFKTRKLF